MLRERVFCYLRHGETDWNRENRWQGRTDIPLNETGRAQAQDAVGVLADSGIASICSSPLSRAKETADIVARGLGLPVTVIDDLMECGMGVGEGRVMGQWYLDWRAGGELQGAERYEDFLRRVLIAINEALEHPGPVLIVGHGGAYRTVKTHARLQYDFRIRNCVPIRHDPPTETGAAWTTTEMVTR